MIRFLFIFSCIFSLVLLSGCSPKPYTISYLEGIIDIDGRDEEQVWSQCDQYDDFISPWDPQAVEETQFQSFYNDEYLYFHFKVRDRTQICHLDYKNDTAVEYSDRVELFFAMNSDMSAYCGLEFDACGRKQQFFSEGYRQFKEAWEFPSLKDLDHTALQTEDGYQVEGRISMKALFDLGMIDEGFIHLGVFRANCKSKFVKEDIQWISWKNIGTDKPDFHNYEGFKKVRLVPKYKKAQMIGKIN